MVGINRLVSAQSITRREFLKFGGLGMIAALGIFPPLPTRLSRLFNQLERHTNPIALDREAIDPNGVLLPNQQGRVLDDAVNVYDIPSFSGTRVNQYFRDWVVPITGVTVGKSIDSFNLVWYKVGGEGYAHSGALQPVFTVTNPVRSDIPIGGALAEVTVPFTDAHWKPGQQEPVAYRYYYATTYWVMDLVKDEEGNPWYGVRDDKWDYMYYVPATHLRLVPASALQPISAGVPSDAVAHSPDAKRRAVGAAFGAGGPDGT